MCVVLAVDNNGLEKHDEIYPLWGKIDKVLTAALHQSSLRIHPRVVDDKVYAALAQDPVRYVKSQGLGNALLLATQAEISESGDSHLLKVVQNLKRLVHGEPQQIAAVQICHETELQDAEYLSIVTAADIIREVSSIPGYQLSPEEQNKVRRALLSSFSDFANLRSEKIKPETINAVRKFLAADEKESIDVREFSRLLNDYQISECGARTTASAGKLRRSYEEKLKLNQ
jgi:hypothetical protein